jgi:hypothetical protein
MTKNKKDWIKYCEKNLVYKHNFKDCNGNNNE